jgi:hypothetical protein
LGWEETACQQREAYSDRLGWRTMVSDIRHYSKKMRRKGNDGTTTRYIVVEDKTAGGFTVNVYEVRPTKVLDADDAGYQYRPVSQQWFSKLEEGVSVAEIAFRSALKSGFSEAVTGTGAGR